MSLCLESIQRKRHINDFYELCFSAMDSDEEEFYDPDLDDRSSLNEGGCNAYPSQSLCG